MKKSEWIIGKLEEGLTASDIYKLYEDFKTDTGSTTSKENFCITVRRYRKKVGKIEGDVKLSKESNGPDTTIVSESHEIRTLEQLLAYTKTDLEKYIVTKHVVNSWGSATNPSYQVKAWISEREPEAATDRENLEDLIEQAKKYAPKYPNIIPKKAKSGNCLEVALFDHHFGQLSWGEETGDRNYDLKIACSMAQDAISDIIIKAKPFDIDQIILPIGNDWFNVNDKTNTTVKGTPQAEDERWQKTFVRGREVWVDILEMARSAAKTKAIWVPGNHDEERSFHLCDSLYCWFNKSDIEIDHSPKPQKVFTWGDNVIFYTHGDKETAGDYPAIFATMFPVEYSHAKYRAVHLGHLHHSDRKGVTVTKDSYSVDIRVKSALVPTNAWSAGKGLRAIARTEGEIWNKKDGLIADLYFNV